MEEVESCCSSQALACCCCVGKECGATVCLCPLALNEFQANGLHADSAQIFAQRGTFPLILTAPHGGREPLNGCCKERERGCKVQDDKLDVLTTMLMHKVPGALCEALQKAQPERGWKKEDCIPYVVIAHAHRKYCDLNRNQENALEDSSAVPYYASYHGIIAKYVDEVLSKTQSKTLPRLLLDIHGQSAVRDAILRGTKNRKTVQRLLSRLGETAFTGPLSILGQMESQGFKLFPACSQLEEAEHPEFNGGWTVRYYSGCECSSSCCGRDGEKNEEEEAEKGLDAAIQLEMGYEFRKSEEEMEKVTDGLARAIATFYAQHTEN
ncbi:N-formylglutamate amidohydrolase [Balamuthia mandrillaris]